MPSFWWKPRQKLLEEKISRIRKKYKCTKITNISLIWIKCMALCICISRKPSPWVCTSLNLASWELLRRTCSSTSSASWSPPHQNGWVFKAYKRDQTILFQDLQKRSDNSVSVSEHSKLTKEHSRAFKTYKRYQTILFRIIQMGVQGKMMICRIFNLLWPPVV